MIPQVPENYVRRIGRTGRAGAQGSAVLWLRLSPDLFDSGSGHHFVSQVIKHPSGMFYSSYPAQVLGLKLSRSNLLRHHWLSS